MYHSTNISGVNVFRQILTQALRKHWVPFLIEGIVLVMLGVLAIVVPLVTAVAGASLYGWLILFSGVAGLVTTLLARNTPGFLWSLVWSVVGVVVGVTLLTGTVPEDVSLSLMLVAFFAFKGAAWSFLCPGP